MFCSDNMSFLTHSTMTWLIKKIHLFVPILISILLLSIGQLDHHWENIIVSDLSGTQDMSIVGTATVRLEYTFANPLTESVALISLNQFETCWEITPDGSVLLDLAP